MRTLLATLLTAVLLPIYLRWSGTQAERQIDKMQAAAFDTPGAESPVTPMVLGGGVALLLAHLIGSRLLRLNAWRTMVSLVLGTAAGIGLFFIFFIWPQERTE